MTPLQLLLSDAPNHAITYDHTWWDWVKMIMLLELSILILENIYLQSPLTIVIYRCETFIVQTTDFKQILQCTSLSGN